MKASLLPKLLKQILLTFIIVLGIMVHASADTASSAISNTNPQSPNYLGQSDQPNLPDPADPYLGGGNSLNYSNGTLQLGLEQSQLYGTIVNSKITKAFGDNNAFALEGDYSNLENRIGGTWGILFTPSQLLKFTAERLSQDLTFTFTSGTVEESIPQYAYGSTYEYILPPNRIFNDLNFNAYYADARSESLAPVNFFAFGGDYIDFRHIAGATSRGLAVGTDVQPWSTAALGLKLNYDQVLYNPEYILKDTDETNENFGGTIDFEQLLISNLKLDLSGSRREIYDDYSGGLSWLSPKINGIQPEFKVSVDRFISHTSTPNDIAVLANMNLMFGTVNGDYPRPLFAANNNLVSWTDDPAVHMEQVIATVDELLQKVGIGIASISPTSGPDLGGTLVTISGTGFAPGANVFFGGTAVLTPTPRAGAVNGGTPAASVSVVNAQTILAVTPRHAPQTVSVSVVNPNGDTATLPNAFTFGSTVPTVASVSPSPGPLTGGMSVTITGTNFTGVTSVTFGGTAATNVVVVNSTTITATTPARALPGPVDVSVTNAAGTGTLTNGFTYTANPIVQSVTPSSGPAAGGTPVIIRGFQFSGTGFTTVAVLFGGTLAPGFVVNGSGTEISVNTPAHAAGAVNVTVIITGGLMGTLVNGFTYT